MPRPCGGAFFRTGCPANPWVRRGARTGLRPARRVDRSWPCARLHHPPHRNPRRGLSGHRTKNRVTTANGPEPMGGRNATKVRFQPIVLKNSVLRRDRSKCRTVSLRYARWQTLFSRRPFLGTTSRVLRAIFRSRSFSTQSARTRRSTLMRPCGHAPQALTRVLCGSFVPFGSVGAGFRRIQSLQRRFHELPLPDWTSKRPPVPPGLSCAVPLIRSW